MCDIVTKAGGAFEQVAGGAMKAGALVGEISAASKEQSQGIEQINRAVAEMDKVTQQNAAMAEQSASAAEEMNSQAQQMKAYTAELMELVGNGAARTRGDRLPIRSGARRPSIGALPPVAGKGPSRNRSLPHPSMGSKRPPGSRGRWDPKRSYLSMKTSSANSKVRNEGNRNGSWAISQIEGH